MTKDEYIKLLKDRFEIPTSELATKSEDELRELFKEKSKERINELTKIIQNELTDEEKIDMSAKEGIDFKAIWKQIIENKDDTLLIYNLFDELIHRLEGSDIMMMLEKYATNEETYQKIYKIYRIKTRQYQEEMLDEIENLCKNMPKEEQFIFLSNIQENRDNIPYLKYLIQKMQNKKNKEMLLRLSNTKEFILKSYFPEEFENEYKRYFETNRIRNELIAKILEEGSIYTSEQLHSKSTQELEDILSFLKDEKIKQKKERENYKKFISMITEARKKEHIHKELSAIVGMMLIELSKDQIKKIVTDIKDADANLGEMLEETLHRSLNEKKFRKK